MWAGSKKTAHVPFCLVVCLIFFNQLKLRNLHVRLFFFFLRLFQRQPPTPPPKGEKQQRTGKPLPFLTQASLLSSGRLLGRQCWDSLGSPWGPGPPGVGGTLAGLGGSPEKWWLPAGLIVCSLSSLPFPADSPVSGEGLGGHVQCIYVRHPDGGHGYLYNPAWVFM